MAGEKDIADATKDAAKKTVGTVGKVVKNVALAPVMLPLKYPKTTMLVGGGLLLGGIGASAALASQAAAGGTASGIGLAGTTSLPFGSAATAGAAGTSTTTTAAAAAAAPEGVLATIGSTVTTGLGHMGNSIYVLGNEGYTIASNADWGMVADGLQGGGDSVAGTIGPTGNEANVADSVFNNQPPVPSLDAA